MSHGQQVFHPWQMPFPCDACWCGFYSYPPGNQLEWEQREVGGVRGGEGGGGEGDVQDDFQAPLLLSCKFSGAGSRGQPALRWAGTGFPSPPALVSTGPVIGEGVGGRRRCCERSSWSATPPGTRSGEGAGAEPGVSMGRIPGAG